MKFKLAMLIVIVMWVAGCKGGKAQSWIGDTLNCVTLENGGYDCQCVMAIRQMFRDGEISRGQAQFLFNQQCKRPQPQQPQRHKEGVCPLCGMIGIPQLGLSGKYWVCPNGHAWK